jgi:putative SOS response-associated peptidase YedK
MLPDVLPDYSAPIVLTAQRRRTRTHHDRWGMSSPVFARKARNSDPSVANMRKVVSHLCSQDTRRSPALLAW